MSNRLWAIIPAAGQGSRFSADQLKQYIRINTKTVLEHSVDALYQLPLSDCIIAISAQDTVAATLRFSHSVHFCIGGKQRMDSVLAGLLQLKHRADPEDYVLVHDAARPYLHSEQIKLIQNFCATGAVAAIVAVPVRDTLKKATSQHCIETTVDRTHLWQAQTPQIVKYGVLLRCLNQVCSEKIVVTDEASALEYCSYPVQLLQGRADNIKLTYPEDIELVQALLQKRTN